ncbi:MBL fold metallo-hydrolase [Streptomyces sp. 3214.6]|uniref:MBL fold metallo-hydrolase n=1 Tax=Streptomyces sp. 3214.6 TaxID=1882757 RepID=UPI00090C7DCE|nr:MBL fold metallo-hydrolase [Streptomyces sp. 3214.6]SHH31248.1 Glyoxylase, beta-lactamase superfamily II [Streptomyces sp. 3214.6]
MSTKLSVDVYTSPLQKLPDAVGGWFSPTTSTLLYGPTEAVLVDAQYIESDVAELARRIEASGRTLTTIFITHAHADHYFGLEWLLARFPQAKAVALPSVVAEITATNDAQRKQWRAWFEGKALDNTAIPDPLDGDTILLDGEELKAIEVGQADVAPATILWVPSIRAVVAGDAIYNGVNPFLAASGPDEWPKWIESVDKIAALEPEIVVAGHKRPEARDDDLTATVEYTRDYIQAFIEELAASSDSRDLVARVQARFPDNLNPSALVLSAVTAWKRKKANHG